MRGARELLKKIGLFAAAAGGLLTKELHKTVDGDLKYMCTKKITADAALQGKFENFKETFVQSQIYQSDPGRTAGPTNQSREVSKTSSESPSLSQLTSQMICFLEVPSQMVWKSHTSGMKRMLGN